VSNIGWAPERAPRMDGRTVMITGANSGLGLASARHLSALGANIVMACRNADKAALAAESLRAGSPAVRIEVRSLDLSSLDSIRRFATGLLDTDTRVDVLMNNAGVMATDQRATEDGFDLQFGTNHLGHFALTGLLLPLLAANPDGARIVNVSSLGHRAGRMHLNDPNFEHRPYRRWGAYFESKLANLLFTAELHRRLEAAGSTVTALAAHPGTASTELGKDGTSTTNWVIRNFFGALVRGPVSGARSQVRAAVDPAARGGQFYGPALMVAGPPRLETPSRRARRADDAKTLWDLSERLTGIAYSL